MANIHFLEVEPEDKGSVLAEFPGAKIFSRPLNENEVIAECADAEILCVFIYSPVTKKVISGLPKLKLIVTRSVGYDHIDLAAAREAGVTVCNVPNYGAHVIAEHVFALLLSGLRHIPEGDKRVEEGSAFTFRGLRGMALKGKTMGIIGTGRIGQNVARIASLGFLMDVIAHDPYPDEDAARQNHFKYAGLDQVWEKSDIISLHCPLLPETRHLISDNSLAKMKDGVVLINTSRGQVIETKALVRALKSGKVAHAFLDVLEHEKNISENEELVKLKGTVTTPHIAFYADDSMHKMYAESFAAIKRFLDGEELVHEVSGV